MQQRQRKPAAGGEVRGPPDTAERGIRAVDTDDNRTLFRTVTHVFDSGHCSEATAFDVRTLRQGRLRRGDARLTQ